MIPALDRLPSRTLAAYLLLWPVFLEGQAPGREPALFELPPSARAAGLGHAYQLGSPGPDVVFHNPAFVGRASGVLFSFTRYAATSGSLSLAAATPWLGGGISIGVQALEYGSEGPGLRDGGIDPIIRGGVEGTSEILGVLGYSRSVGPVTLGVAGKLVAQRFGPFRESRGSVDLGLARSFGGYWVGLAGRNLGPDYSFDDVEVSQAEELTLGAGRYGLQVGELDMGFASSLTRRADGEWLFGGGLEVGYYPVTGRTFVVRAGGRTVPEGEASPLTFGASYWGDSLVLEYAFQPVDNQSGIHRLTVGWR